MKKVIFQFVILFSCITGGGLSFKALASEYVLNSDSRLIGENIRHKVHYGDYFQALAEYYNVGFLSLMAANPNIDPFLPKEGAELIIPKQMILPFAKRKGIVVNLAELRLYYFPEDSSKVHVFPIGIGKHGFSTPETISYISEKRKDPIWRPTAAARARYFKEHNKTLAREVMPGPNNPFGKYALRIGRSEYLLHGSNVRFGIGMRASSGCIRMYDDDIEWLYENIALNTPINIVNQPIKMTYHNKSKRFIEIHQPLSETKTQVKSVKFTPAVERFLGKEKLMVLEQIKQQPTGLVQAL